MHNFYNSLDQATSKLQSTRTNCTDLVNLCKGLPTSYDARAVTPKAKSGSDLSTPTLTKEDNSA